MKLEKEKNPNDKHIIFISFLALCSFKPLLFLKFYAKYGESEMQKNDSNYNIYGRHIS